MSCFAVPFCFTVCCALESCIRWIIFGRYFGSYFSFTLFWASMILGFSYITVYVFVPKYLYKKKYISFCLAIVGIYVVMYFINAFQTYYQMNKTFNITAGIPPWISFNLLIYCGFLEIRRWSVVSSCRLKALKTGISG